MDGPEFTRKRFSHSSQSPQSTAESHGVSMVHLGCLRPSWLSPCVRRHLLFIARCVVAGCNYALGDLTVGSGLLAVVTAALPCALLLGVVQRLRAGVVSVTAKVELAVMLAVLQFTALLAYWALLPLSLWR